MWGGGRGEGEREEEERGEVSSTASRHAGCKGRRGDHAPFHHAKKNHLALPNLHG